MFQKLLREPPSTSCSSAVSSSRSPEERARPIPPSAASRCIRSGLGLHLVRITERIDGQPLKPGFFAPGLFEADGLPRVYFGFRPEVADDPDFVVAGLLGQPCQRSNGAAALFQGE
jgi:hypothetical protein